MPVVALSVNEDRTFTRNADRKEDLRDMNVFHTRVQRKLMLRG